jgi:hypothetical protein
MKHLLSGAVLGVLAVVFGVPLTPVVAVLSVLVEPVTVAFAAGLLAAPLLPGMQRWMR